MRHMITGWVVTCLLYLKKSELPCKSFYSSVSEVLKAHYCIIFCIKNVLLIVILACYMTFLLTSSVKTILVFYLNYIFVAQSTS